MAPIYRASYRTSRDATERRPQCTLFIITPSESATSLSTCSRTRLRSELANTRIVCIQICRRMTAPFSGVAANFVYSPADRTSRPCPSVRSIFSQICRTDTKFLARLFAAHSLARGRGEDLAEEERRERREERGVRKVF